MLRRRLHHDTQLRRSQLQGAKPQAATGGYAPPEACLEAVLPAAVQFMPMPIAYPLLFAPILKERIWGGRTLELLGKQLPPGRAIGESWELADLPASVPDGQSRIANGPWRGRTLRDVLTINLQLILGRAKPAADGGFPLLIKYLDAREKLSVQVHPGADYATAHSAAARKSEAWYIVDARPGAVVYRGLRPGVDPQRVREGARSGAIVHDLVSVPVQSGDVIDLPSGIVHALGDGIVAAEVQTPCDTTFRIFDWGRQGRELHVEQALQCIDFADPAPRQRLPAADSREADGLVTTPLLTTADFGVECMRADSSIELPLHATGLPAVWMVVAGSAIISLEENMPGLEAVDMPLGSTALMPAGFGAATARLEPGTTVLRITPPDAS
jgi:mannose-6-phosphate isomerase